MLREPDIPVTAREEQEMDALMAKAAAACCADPRPDCMGMLVKGIGDSCKAMTEPHWYAIDKHGAATLCIDEEDAITEAANAAAQWPEHAPYRAVQLVEPIGLLEQHHRDSAELRRLCEARDQARRTADHWKAEHLAGNVVIKQMREALQWTAATLQAACRMPEPIRETGEITLAAEMRTVAAILDAADAALSLQGKQ